MQIESEKNASRPKAAKQIVAAEPDLRKEKKSGLTFREKRELEELASEIEKLESEKKGIESEMSDGRLLPDELFRKSVRHGEIMKMLDDREMRWLELSEK
jgi:ATP-binding cassette subfamily F protein uup